MRALENFEFLIFPVFKVALRFPKPFELQKHGSVYLLCRMQLIKTLEWQIYETKYMKFSQIVLSSIRKT